MAESNYDILGIMEGSTERKFEMHLDDWHFNSILIVGEKMNSLLKLNKHTMI